MNFFYDEKTQFYHSYKTKFSNLCMEITQVKNIYDSATPAQCCFFEEKKQVYRLYLV